MNEFIKQLVASASLPQLVAQATAGGSRAEKGVLPEAIILIGGLVVFCIWFFKTSFGRKALLWSEPRRNNMHPSVPFFVMFAYFGLAPFVFFEVCRIWKMGEESWQYYFVNNCLTGTFAIVTAIIVILLVRESFARRLKGFGLSASGPRSCFARSCGGDFGSALLNLWAVCPILMAMLILTTEIGKFIYGPDYNMGQHQELKTIATYHQLSLIISVVVVAVVIAPVIEELLFRGLLQNMVRSYGYGPWLSIATGSFFFVLFHANPSHWPALFVLSIGIGYSYERSGSILRPIFVHAIFNAVSVVATLLTVHPS